jgi:hypothetical protein
MIGYMTIRMKPLPYAPIEIGAHAARIKLADGVLCSIHISIAA